MNTLVIGGTRFLGLYVVDQLLREGHHVTVLNRGLTPGDLPPEVERLRADRRDRSQMQAALAGRRFDAVLDMVCEEVVDAEILTEVLPGMGHYVLCSGTRIYALSDIFPDNEDSPLDPSPPPGSVGANRLICMKIFDEAGRRNGYPVTVIRPYRIYGPHNYYLTWEPSYFARVEQGRPIIVPRDGLNVTQWVHVADLARAFTVCLGNSRSHGETYIVAGDEIATFNGYFRLIGEIVGKKPQILYLDPRRVAELEQPVYPYAWDFSRIFSCDKIAEHLGWRPEINLRAGLEDCYRWYKEAGLDKHPWDFSYEAKVAATIDYQPRVLGTTAPRGTDALVPSA